MSSFDLGRLSLRLGPTPYLPSSPPVHPCPWTAWPKSFMHIAPCQLQNMNGIITQLYVVHISRRPIFWHNMLEWVMVHCSSENLQTCKCTISKHVTTNANASVLFQSMLELCTASLCASVMGIAIAAIGNCIKANVAPRHPRRPYSTIQI